MNLKDMLLEKKAAQPNYLFPKDTLDQQRTQLHSLNDKNKEFNTQLVTASPEAKPSILEAQAKNKALGLNVTDNGPVALPQSKTYDWSDVALENPYIKPIASEFLDRTIKNKSNSTVKPPVNMSTSTPTPNVENYVRAELQNRLQTDGYNSTVQQFPNAKENIDAGMRKAFTEYAESNPQQVTSTGLDLANKQLEKAYNPKTQRYEFSNEQAAAFNGLEKSHPHIYNAIKQMATDGIQNYAKTNAKYLIPLFLAMLLIPFVGGYALGNR